jgi:recombination protein RecA
MRASALRAQVETALGSRYGQPFTFHERRIAETVSCGISEVDAITGGLPRGGLTELFGPTSSGRTSLLVSLLAKMTAREEVCALIDAQDAFDPHSAQAAGVELQRLLWLRCRGMEQALKVMDLLIHSGGFGLVALDVGDIPPRMVRRVPLAYWFRFQRAVEHTPTIVLLVEQESYAKSAASLVLRLKNKVAHWSATSLEKGNTPSCLLDGLEINAEIVRSRILVPQYNSSIASFRTKTLWSLESDYPSTPKNDFQETRHELRVYSYPEFSRSSRSA